MPICAGWSQGMLFATPDPCEPQCIVEKLLRVRLGGVNAKRTRNLGDEARFVVPNGNAHLSVAPVSDSIYIRSLVCRNLTHRPPLLGIQSERAHIGHDRMLRPMNGAQRGIDRLARFSRRDIVALLHEPCWRKVESPHSCPGPPPWPPSCRPFLRRHGMRVRCASVCSV